MINTKEIMKKLNESGFLMTAKINFPELRWAQKDVAEFICAIPKLCHEIDDLLRTKSELVIENNLLRKTQFELTDYINERVKKIEELSDQLVEEHERVLKLEKALKEIANNGHGAWCGIRASEALAKQDKVED